MTMKTKKGIWFIATLLYSALFYDQSAGINFLFFNLLLVAAVFVLQPHLKNHRSAIIVAGGLCIYFPDDRLASLLGRYLAEYHLADVSVGTEFASGIFVAGGLD